MSNEIFLLKAGITLFCLTLASYLDWEKREIDDKIWIILGSSGGFLTLVEVLQAANLETYTLTAFSISLAFVIGYLIYYTGFTGGADFKALLAIGLTFPKYPSNTLLQPQFPNYPVFILSVLDNTLVLTIVVVLFYLVMKNSSLILKGEKMFSYRVPLWRKIALFLTATKVIVKKTDWKKYFPVETVDYSMDPPMVKIRLFTSVHEDIDEERLNNAVDKGILEEKIWASTGLPLIIFISLGTLTSIAFGDLILKVIFILFSI